MYACHLSLLLLASSLSLIYSQESGDVSQSFTALEMLIGFFEEEIIANGDGGSDESILKKVYFSVILIVVIVILVIGFGCLVKYRLAAAQEEKNGASTMGSGVMSSNNADSMADNDKEVPRDSYLSMSSAKWAGENEVNLDSTVSMPSIGDEHDSYAESKVDLGAFNSHASSDDYDEDNDDVFKSEVDLNTFRITIPELAEDMDEFTAYSVFGSDGMDHQDTLSI